MLISLGSYHWLVLSSHSIKDSHLELCAENWEHTAVIPAEHDISPSVLSYSLTTIFGLFLMLSHSPKS